jgi:hypothetical protein
MLPRVGVGGSPVFTATYFVPSVSYAIRGHSRDAAARAANGYEVVREEFKSY